MRKPKLKKSQRTSSARPPEPARPDKSTPGREGAHKTQLTWICALTVLVVTWLVFQPALDGEWLRWDDDKLLLDVQDWRGFTAQHLRWMFTTFHMGPYQPLSWLSYAVDQALFGLDARAFHRTNVLLHAASAVTLFFLARAIFAIALAPRAAGTVAKPAHEAVAFDPARHPASVDIAAALSALFWAIHPLRVESVAWITERRDCLSGLCFLLTLNAWLVYVRSATRRGRWYWFAVLAFAASLLSKGLGMTLPFVLLALDVWPLGRLAGSAADGSPASRFVRLRALLWEKAPFFLLSSAAALLAFVGQKVTGAMVKAEIHDFSARVVQSFYGLAFYVRKTVWPDELMVMYPMRVPLNAGELRFVIAITAVTIAAVLLVGARRRAPAAAVAFAAYVLLIAPVLGLIQTGSQLVADRYSYLATIPLVLLAGGVVLRTRARGALFGGGALLVFGACLLPLAHATERQIPVWHDTLSLWQHDVAIDPTDNPGRRNLIAAWEVAGRSATTPAQRKANYERGLEVCRRGLELAPDAACLSHAAKIYDLLAAEDSGQAAHYQELALDHALRSVQLVERTGQRLPEAYESAGVILAELGRPGEAVPYLDKLVALDPSSATRQGMLGEVLMQAGRTKDALVPLEAARRLDPSSTTIDLDLGDAYRQLGDRDQAVAAYRRVVERKRTELGTAAAADPEHAAAVRALVELGQKP